MIGDGLLARLDAVASLAAAVQPDEDDRGVGDVLRREVEYLGATQKEAVFAGLTDVTNLFGTVLDDINKRLHEEHAGPEEQEEQEEHEGAVHSITIKDPAVADVISRLVTRAAMTVRGGDRGELLRRSLLGLLVSEFELVISRVASVVLGAKPGRVNPAEASLSLADLQDLGSIAAAVEVIIERRVDDLMRGGLGDWEKWFKASGIDLTGALHRRAELTELLARRNLLVHNDGEVNRRYLTIVAPADADAVPQLGTVLNVSEEYLMRSLELILGTGVLVVGGTLLQLDKSDSEATYNWLASRTETLIESGRPRSGSDVSTQVLQSSRDRLPMSLRLQLQIANWTCRRDLGENDAVLKEVAEWDTRGVDLKYAHARDVLLDDDDSAIRSIRELVRRGNLSIVAVRNWPLYRPLIDRHGLSSLTDSTPEVGLDESSGDATQDDATSD